VLALPAPGGGGAGPLAALGGLAPQVQVVNGRIVVNEQSLTVAAPAGGDAAAAAGGALRRVEESGAKLNSATYSNRTKPERWSTADTGLFYRALAQFGTDFSLIERLFPGRTRRQIKSKFNAEERADPRRIEAALRDRSCTNGEQYRDMIELLRKAKQEAEENAIAPPEAIEQAAPVLAIEQAPHAPMETEEAVQVQVPPPVQQQTQQQAQHTMPPPPPRAPAPVASPHAAAPAGAPGSKAKPRPNVAPRARKEAPAPAPPPPAPDADDDDEAEPEAAAPPPPEAPPRTQVMGSGAAVAAGLAAAQRALAMKQQGKAPRGSKAARTAI